MARKGEEREGWTGEGAAPVRDERPGERVDWLDPVQHHRAGERRDPFQRRRPLGPKGYRRPDDRIRDEVCERIARSGIDAREVEVAVEQGEVTLTGTVESREDKRALEDVSDDVFGVEDVHNRLRLAHAAAPPPIERPAAGVREARGADARTARPRGRRRR